MKKLFVLFLVFTMMLGVMTTSASAASTQFSDVPADFWACDSIEALADGGLISGYGNGKFGPNDTLNIDQLATIICRAKGYPQYEKDGYWAYGALESCRRVGCLPLMEELTRENFSVPCTREMAAYMIMRGIVLGNSIDSKYFDSDSEEYLDILDIPDQIYIKAAYEEAVVHAYNMGIISGIDSEGTFDPQGKLTRAQACEILYRVGCTEEAKEIVDMNEVSKSIFAIYDEIEHWTGWREWIGEWWAVSGDTRIPEISNRTLNATIYTYGDVRVTCSYTNHLMTIDMEEPGGWTYEARQLVKRILQVAYPTAYEELYQDLLAVMNSEVFESPRYNYASTISWRDNRMFQAYLAQDVYFVVIYIGEVGDTTHYERLLVEEDPGYERTYRSRSGKDVAELYEFDCG